MFIDTNVFVNSRIPRAPDHDIARARLERALQAHEPLRISRQIVREYLVGRDSAADMAGCHHA